MITSRNNRFFKGGFSGLMIAAAILCGAFAAQADYKTQTDANFLVYGPVENQGGVGLVIYVR